MTPVVARKKLGPRCANAIPVVPPAQLINPEQLPQIKISAFL